MAVNPANMEDCFPKSRCLAGPNEGVAYDRDSPCGGAANVSFNPVTCDCEQDILCGEPDECGYDIQWERPGDTSWSIKPCLANVCFVYCDRDEYQACFQSPYQSGEFYLSPGQCLRKVKNTIEGPCPDTAPPPAGSFQSEYWYSCPDTSVEPSFSNCGTPVVQVPGPGLCAGVWVGDGVREAGRVQRVKVATSTTVDYTIITGRYIGCGEGCGSGATGTSSGSNSISWPAPVDTGSLTAFQYGNISGDCPEGPSGCGTWDTVVGGAEWARSGNQWVSGSQQAPCGIADAIGVKATVAVTTGAYQKGDVIAWTAVSSGGGAVGCTMSGNSIDDIRVSSYSCYKPSDLV
ncbi:hypothetical protein SCRES3_gp98 [Synechococcus phage S-CRES3]|nr:hypothetical protein SCRES3_gp98 [Synechococcus phage S-CRES3]